MPFGKFSKMVLIFALNGKPSSPNTIRGKLQADRLPIQTATVATCPCKRKKRLQKPMTLSFKWKFSCVVWRKDDIFRICDRFKEVRGINIGNFAFRKFRSVFSGIAEKDYFFSFNFHQSGLRWNLIAVFTIWQQWFYIPFLIVKHQWYARGTVNNVAFYFRRVRFPQAKRQNNAQYCTSGGEPKAFQIDFAPQQIECQDKEKQ